MVGGKMMRGIMGRTLTKAGAVSVWLLVVTTTCFGAEIRPADIAARIDRHLAVDVNDESRFASPEEFLRRVTLDLAGRIPTVAEVHEFLGDSSTSRRAGAIERLMQAGIYSRNMATFWRRSWVPQADTREFESVTDNFELWLAQRLRAGGRYDDLVIEVMTLDAGRSAGAGMSPTGFYDANQSKPENLAASATRSFLGNNLDCAQCHDHPFSRWTREQFWQTAAFFAAPADDGQGGWKLPQVRVPDTKLEYQPVLLSEGKPEWPEKIDSVGLRSVLARWMKDEPEHLLAKNAVNRLWAHFFGEAIIEPIDDLSRDEFQSGERAALLADLSTAFIESGYDLDVMVAGMVHSQAYRLRSIAAADPATDVSETKGSEESGKGGTQSGAMRFTVVRIRGLTGEQLYDSLQTAAGLPPERNDLGNGRQRGRRREIASQFFVERTNAAERSISQALTLMNGTLVNEMTTAKGNPLLASLVSAPFLSLDEQRDTVFVAVLGRHARPEELAAVGRAAELTPQTSREEHLGNLFWVLVNSPEFNTNH